MMTLDEAIEHAEWCADNSCGECAEEHRQLAEWLKELKQWQKLVEGIDLRPESLMKPFQPNVDDLERENDMLKAENAKLRSERDHWRVEQVHAYGNWKDVHRYAAKLKAENDKLRKLARVYRACHDHINACRGCVELPQGCDALDIMRTLGSELGIEALFEQVY